MSTVRFPTRMCRWSDVAIGLSLASLCTCGGFGVLPLLALGCGIVALRAIKSADGALFGRAQAVTAMLLAVAALAEGGICWTVFATAREKARQASCAANIKQLELGVLQYAQDWDGRLPMPEQTWNEAIWPYLKHDQVFICPTAGLQPSYGVPEQLLGVTLDSQPALELYPPMSTVMVYERDHRGAQAWPHGGGANFGYVDGHVEWQPRPEE